MIAGTFMPAQQLEGPTMQKKQLFEWSIGSLQMCRIVKFVALFSPLYHPAKEQDNNMSIKIQIYFTKCY